MSLLNFWQYRENSAAAAFDTAPNVATRVLSIVPRYRALGDKYGEIFGPDMLRKAECLEQALARYPDLLKNTAGFSLRTGSDRRAGRDRRSSSSREPYRKPAEG